VGDSDVEIDGRPPAEQRVPHGAPHEHGLAVARRHPDERPQQRHLRRSQASKGELQ